MLFVNRISTLVASKRGSSVIVRSLLTSSNGVRSVSEVVGSNPDSQTDQITVEPTTVAAVPAIEVGSNGGLRKARHFYGTRRNVAGDTVVQPRRNVQTEAQVKEQVISGPWPEMDIPEISIPEYMFRNAHKIDKNKPALINALTGETYTFPKVKDSVWRITSGLARHGVRSGDRLLIISDNSVEYVLMFHAVLCLGATVTMANPHYLAADIANQAADANATFIFTSKVYAVKSLEVAKALKNKIKKIFVAGEKTGCVPLSNLLSDDGSCYPENVNFKPQTDIACLPYSSGTTGMPKGVMLSHYNLVANSLQTDVWTEPRMYVEREGAILLGILPFYHIYAVIVNVISSLALGQTTVVIPNFEPKIFLETIQKYKVNTTFIVPPIVLFLNKHPSTAKFDLTSLSRVVCGAAPLGAEMVNEMHAKRPHITVGQAYGMTETSPGVTINPLSSCRTKPASSGLPFPNTRIKVVDPVTRKNLLPGDRGEICIKGPQVMMGYLNNKAATDHMIDSEGWLHTGDIGSFDADNHMFIVDRVKELIKYKGLQVPPAELEAILCNHDAVADAGVIGIDDTEAGELPRAYVSLKPGSSVSADELQKYVADKVVSYKKLRGGVEFLPQIPRSPSGKILRRDLKEHSMSEPKLNASRSDPKLTVTR